MSDNDTTTETPARGGRRLPAKPAKRVRAADLAGKLNAAAAVLLAADKEQSPEAVRALVRAALNILVGPANA